MDGYRLRNLHGDTLDPRQPLPVNTMGGQATTSTAPTLTYNGKAAAGAVTVNSLVSKPIISVEGDQVASYWGLEQNRVYSAVADGKSKNSTSWLRSVTETNGSAAFTIYDPNKNLEEMFESATSTVKRFIGKVYDKSGGVLYGWIRGVSVASNVYTFEVFNNRLTEGNQNWVGVLANFDNAALDKVEIYHYNSSLSFGTGTTLTEEVQCPREYSKSWESVMKYAETLDNGQYVVDYMRGRIIGPKADTTASETVTYNILQPSGGGGDATAANQSLQLTQETAIATSTAIMDDWDESDRVKVNCIVGQAGVAAGTGVDGVTVQRVTLATNVPLPAGTNNIGDVDVLTVPRSQMGPAQPGTAIDSYSQFAINLAAGADQVLVSSAAAKQIWVYGYQFTVNVAGSVSFQDEDNVALSGIMLFGTTGGASVSPSGNFSMPIWKLGTDKDLEVDVVTSELDGWLTYAIVSV